MTLIPGPAPSPLGATEHQERSFPMAPRKSVTVSTKGLLNMPGQNNCFLNSAVQVLWHLDSFRRNFRELSGHACMAESCIFCALKELFTQFQYSHESALPPDALRHALAKTFCDQRRFQLGFMDDAAECFENILLRIHVHIANQETDDMCGNLNCIPHQKFAMTIVEQRICHNCGFTSEPLPFNQMVHYVSTSALCSKSIENQELDPNCRPSNSFGRFLQLAGDVGEIRECPSGCGSKIKAKKSLMNHPEVVSIGLVWGSESPTLQHITDVFHSIGMYLKLQDMFHHVFDTEWASVTTHQLVGVVTYYGKHYSTFFFHTKLRIWIYFDDATVREVGPSWEQVVEKCQRGRFQPLLLLFANPDSSINASNINHSTQYSNYLMNNPMMHNPASNQKQTVIKKYLMMQNTYQNTNELMKNANMLYYNPTSEPYPYHKQQTSNNGLPASQNNHYANTFHLTQGLHNHPLNNQSPPVYSNLQHLSSMHYKQEQIESLKLNEAALPSVTSLPTLPPKNNLQLADSKLYDSEFEAQNKEKNDFDAAKDSDSAFTEEDPDGSDMYISRKTVENVLNLQKRQLSLCRSYSQSSVGNRNSNSSLESFDTLNGSKFINSKSQIPENVPSRRDSGSWSSDRNSSSSNNSIENPFLTVLASKRLLLGLNKKSHLPDYSNTNTSDHGYDSYSVSSSDSYPSVNGSPAKPDPRLTQIPEDWQPEEEDTNLDKKLKLITEDSSGPPDCDKLCAEADLLLAKSHEKEKDGDLVMAALLCDSAAARARAAMEAPYNNSKSLISAKMKHSTCVMRSSNLYRRLKDHEMDERRKQKSHAGHHSRQSSRDSTHSRHSRQGSKDSTHSKNSGKDSNHNSDDAENFGKNIEIYGTLPKKGSRKKLSSTSVSPKIKDDQVYKDFLDKQRKNTSLPNSSNETKQKKGDVNQHQPESSAKIKGQPSNPEKTQRKSISEGIPPKSPTRKKPDTSPQSEPETRKKGQKITEPSFQGLFPEDKVNGLEISSRDLLSPINSADKKQHKIKRKLMGGFMKRKNRSLPDLREDQDLSDPFLDDVVIQAPSKIMLPNGKSKKVETQSDGTVGSITRGFHQPHHAFVKKDLTQRPLLMKVNPPNVQPSVLSSPKTKLVHTLPSIPRKAQEIEKLDTAMNANMKPSKIPFMPALPKPEITNLPPLPSFKANESKCLPKPGFINKTSAIPVLTPQVPLSPIKAPTSTTATTVKDSTQEGDTQLQPAPEKQDKEELTHPSNPFLAELQAKRKQVLSKSTQKLEEAQVNKQPARLSSDNVQLPKLAVNAESTSWLKELQNKQQQMLNKQDNSNAAHKAMNVIEKESTEKTSIQQRNDDAESKQIDVAEAKKQQLFSDDSLRTQRESFPTEEQNKKTCSSENYNSSVRDLASRFEKVLKPKEALREAPVTGPTNVSINRAQNCVVEVNNGNDEFLSNKLSQIPSNQAYNRNSLSSINSALPLKSALKSRSDYNTNSDHDSRLQLPRESANDADSSSKGIKLVLKQETPTNPNDSHGLKNSGNTIPQRPMQPPDYATAMQRLELIRTSAGEATFQNLAECNQSLEKISSSPKKKQGVKKTVTFSDEVVLVACAEYDEIDFSSNPLFERVYQQHVESGKGEIPIFSNNFGNLQERNQFDDLLPNETVTDLNVPNPCDLCHSKQVSPPSIYCADCEFYLSRFKP